MLLSVKKDEGGDTVSPTTPPFLPYPISPHFLFLPNPPVMLNLIYRGCCQISCSFLAAVFGEGAESAGEEEEKEGGGRLLLCGGAAAAAAPLTCPSPT